MALGVSGCALPPMVTMASVAADVFSYGETGKSVTDHGISLVMKQDCALLRVFQGAVCSDYPPAESRPENTPEGALVALAPIADPSISSAAADPMIVPPQLAYLDTSLGLAVAGAREPSPVVSRPLEPRPLEPSLGVRTASFAGFGENLAAVPVSAPAHGRDLSYLKAGIDG